MSLIDLLIFFLLAFLSSRCLKEVFRVSEIYLMGQKHVGVGNPQAHSDRPASCPSLAITPTSRVEAPKIHQSKNLTSLRPGNPPNSEPYVPAYELFFPKVPGEALGKKQFFREVIPSRVFDLENCDPYVPAYELFFPKVPGEALGKKQFFRPVVPRRVFDLENCNPYVPPYTQFFKNQEPNVHVF